jgi:hypothetical protein
VCCLAPRACIISRPGWTCDCANASWRWLKTLDTALTKRRTFLSLADGSQSQTLHLLILETLAAMVEVNGKYLCSAFDSFKFGAARPSNFRDSLTEEIVEEIGTSVFITREIENAINDIGEAIECVLSDLRPPSQSETAAHNRGTTSVDAPIRDLQQDCSIYRNRASRFREAQIEAQEIHLKRVNGKQADSVNRLTLLAAIFLPLSLAAGVLSMQTRFADLNILLYDFVGVVILLGSITAFLAALNRWGPWIYAEAIDKVYDGAIDGDDFVIRFTPLMLWWMAVLASFLVGMFDDVMFGLRVLGYEAAGITLLWMMHIIVQRIISYHDQNRW